VIPYVIEQLSSHMRYTWKVSTFSPMASAVTKTRVKKPPPLPPSTLFSEISVQILRWSVDKYSEITLYLYEIFLCIYAVHAICYERLSKSLV